MLRGESKRSQKCSVSPPPRDDIEFATTHIHSSSSVRNMQNNTHTHIDDTQRTRVGVPPCVPFAHPFVFPAKSQEPRNTPTHIETKKKKTRKKQCACNEDRVNECSSLNGERREQLTTKRDIKKVKKTEEVKKAFRCYVSRADTYAYRRRIHDQIRYGRTFEQRPGSNEKKPPALGGRGGKHRKAFEKSTKRKRKP